MQRNELHIKEFEEEKMSQVQKIQKWTIVLVEGYSVVI